MFGTKIFIKTTFHTHTHIYIYTGAELEILVWGGPRLNYLVVSHNSRKTQNAMYMFLCIGLINVILISTLKN